MGRLLFLIILCTLPSSVVPIHNSSAGGKLCEWMCRNVFVCLLSAFMERSSSAESKWPVWNTVICAARMAPVKWIMLPIDVSASVIILFSFFLRLRHHPTSEGRRDPLPRPDAGAGTGLLHGSSGKHGKNRLSCLYLFKVKHSPDLGSDLWCTDTVTNFHNSKQHVRDFTPISQRRDGDLRHWPA